MNVFQSFLTSNPSEALVVRLGDMNAYLVGGSPGDGLCKDNLGNIEKVSHPGRQDYLPAGGMGTCSKLADTNPCS